MSDTDLSDPPRFDNASTGLVVADFFPPIESMDFGRDCDKYGAWLSAYLAPDPWTPNEVLGGSIALSIGLLEAAIPDDWYFPGEMVGNDTIWYARLTDWWIEKIYVSVRSDGYWDSDPRLNEYAVVAPMTKCPAEYCKAMAWVGNADMTGIGIFISYYMEACLATVYLVAYTVWHLRRHYEKKRTRHAQAMGGKPHVMRTFTEHGAGWQGRVLDAFRGSTPALLGGTLLIGLVMLIAAIYTAVVKSRARVLPPNLQDVPTGSAIYDILLSLLASTFSCLPIIVVYALMKQPDEAEVSHRQWLRRIALAAVWILGIAEVFLAPRGDLDYDERHDDDYQGWDCDQRGGKAYWQGLKASQFMVIGVPLTWAFITVFLVTGFHIPGLVDRTWVKKTRAVWRLLVAWITLGLMWGILGYFTVLRHNIIHTSDGLDKNDEWTFGNILAVSAWVPSIIEFLYILIFGLEDNLQGRMPENYKVQYVDPANRDAPHAVPLMKDRHDSSGDMAYFSPAKGAFDVSKHEVGPQSPALEPEGYRSNVSHAGHVSSWGSQDTRLEDPDSQTPWKQLNSQGW